MAAIPDNLRELWKTSAAAFADAQERADEILRHPKRVHDHVQSLLDDAVNGSAEHLGYCCQQGCGEPVFDCDEGAGRVRIYDGGGDLEGEEVYCAEHAAGCPEKIRYGAWMPSTPERPDGSRCPVCGSRSCNDPKCDGIPF